MIPRVGVVVEVAVRVAMAVLVTGGGVESESQPAARTSAVTIPTVASVFMNVLIVSDLDLPVPRRPMLGIVPCAAVAVVI